MRVRIKFSKGEPVKYLGHLDILRFFQHCFVRADVKMSYSIGFNPHQKLSFALPLGVGITSEAEYLDADIADGQDAGSLAERLNATSGIGFRILSVKEVEEGAVKVMSAVKYAAYSVTYQGTEDLAEALSGADSLSAVKTTKSGSREIDLKPLVYRFEKSGDAYKMILSAGSEENLKPELLMQTLIELKGGSYKREDLVIVRTELMADGFVPLSDYQTL